MKPSLNKLAVLLASIALTSCSTFEGQRVVASSARDSIFANAYYNYNHSESDRITDFVEDIHKEYDLFIANYNNYHESFIGEYNKHKLKAKSRVKVYSDLEFRKSGDFYKVTYTPYHSNNPVFIDLSPRHTKFINELFADLQMKASFIEIDGITSRARGGRYLSASNLPMPQTITLKCKSEVFLDKSGGNSCEISVKHADLNSKDTKFFINSQSEVTLIEKKDLSKWDK